MASKRDGIRNAATDLLRQCKAPQHGSAISEPILPQLDLAENTTAKDIITSLHGDPQGRFVGVAKGTWTVQK